MINSFGSHISRKLDAILDNCLRNLFVRFLRYNILNLIDNRFLRHLDGVSISIRLKWSSWWLIF